MSLDEYEHKNLKMFTGFNNEYVYVDNVVDNSVAIGTKSASNKLFSDDFFDFRVSQGDQCLSLLSTLCNQAIQKSENEIT